jgi:hypothetical protein
MLVDISQPPSSLLCGLYFEDSASHISKVLCFSDYFSFFPGNTGFELKAYILGHSTSPFFVMAIFEIGSHELFAQAGFEPRSS